MQASKSRPDPLSPEGERGSVCFRERRLLVHAPCMWVVALHPRTMSWAMRLGCRKITGKIVHFEHAVLRNLDWLEDGSRPPPLKDDSGTNRTICTICTSDVMVPAPSPSVVRRLHGFF